MGWASAIGSFLAGIAKAVALPLLAYMKGRGDERQHETAERLEARDRAAHLRNRLRDDPVFRERVRARFTRR